MQLTGHGHTHAGRARDNNEDAYFTDDALGCYIVCDGVGGHAGGEVASAAAIKAAVAHCRAAQEQLQRVAKGDEPASALEPIARGAALAACAAVYQGAQDDRALAGMATTLTMLLTAGSHAALAHIGDSRCYLVRDGQAAQLSVDHTYAEELRATGKFDEAQIARSPFAHALSRAVGMQPAVAPDILLVEIAAGDQFVLCSDGLTRYFNAPSDLAERMPKHAAEAPQSLVEFANAAGGQDNITVVVVDTAAADTMEPADLRRSSDSARRVNVLVGVPLFRGFRLPIRALIVAACEEREATAGEQLWSPGAARDSMLILLAGHLELLDEDGERREVLDPGDAIGEDRLLLPGPARIAARAVTDVRWLELSGASMWSLARTRPRLGLELSRRLGERTAGRLRQWKDRVRSESRDIWESTRLLDLV